MSYIHGKPSIDEVVDELLHSGTPHEGMIPHSGRYKYGSGENPVQRFNDFNGRIKYLEAKGLSQKEIAKSLNMSTGELRDTKRHLKSEKDTYFTQRCVELKKHGYSNPKIAEMLDLPGESSVRNYLKAERQRKASVAQETADFLKKQVDEKGVILISKGVEYELANNGINVSQAKLKEAYKLLEEQGYYTFGNRIPQATNPGQMTTIKVLAPPGTPYKIKTQKNGKEIRTSAVGFDYENIHTITDYTSKDGGVTFEKKFVYPASLDSKRLAIRYADDKGPDGATGIQKDGLIEIRRGCKDLDLNGNTFAQVRIMVDGTHYIKGMAMYSDNLPAGKDVVFNTNKKSTVAMKDVLKKIKDDPDNPFGSNVKDIDKGGQYYYTDSKGDKKLGLINKCRAEGDWSDWTNSVPSQFLSKQPLSLAKRQLNLNVSDKSDELKDIMSLTNGTVKKNLLMSFADDCDATAEKLNAAALPRQKYHVIIPMNCLKDNECYCPNYENGTKIAAIRFPHGGPFEIPILTVNNKNKVAKSLLGNCTDGIGITSKVAERLSGADFDGDTVMVIPLSDKVKIKSTPALKGLEGFDPKVEYGTVEKDEKYYNYYGKEIKVMKEKYKGRQMGEVSNLITDMTLKGATEDEKARAVRHSMVVIDAVKHHLDYEQSYIDNGIAELKRKYQGHIGEDGKYHEGASTIISSAKSDYMVDKRQGTPKINTKLNKDGTKNKNYDPSRPEGALLWKTADDVEYAFTKKDKYGNEKYISGRHKQKSTKMAETDDARTLISDEDTAMERLYADYANKMKALANEARKAYVFTDEVKLNKQATKLYSEEVISLNDKLVKSIKNKPKETAAQIMTAAEIKAKIKDNPNITNEEIKKASDRALKKYRQTTGAERNTIEITDKEWEAIQAGAISKTKLKDILDYTDMDKLKQRAMPKNNKEISSAQENRIKRMANLGYTQAEIAKQVGVSVSTVIKYIK